MLLMKLKFSKMTSLILYPVFLSFVIYLCVNNILCYENVYDLLEERNQQRMYQPYHRHQASEIFLNFDDRNHFYTQNRNPYSRHSYLGNGYDNLGNGISNNYFHPIRPETRQFTGDWRFERRPFARKTYNDRFGFVGFPTVGNDYYGYDGRYHSGTNYPYLQGKSTSWRKSHGGEYGLRGDFEVSKTDRILEDNENKKHKKTDEIFQQNHESTNSDSIRREKVGEHSHTDRLGENKSSLRSNKVVKKGHMTKGFASHHHKDETGNSTTFFDEYSDFGGQSDFKDIADGFGTKKTLDHFTNTGDEKFYRESGGQAGNYGSGLTIGNQKFEKDLSSGVYHLEGAQNLEKGNNNKSFDLKKNYHYLNGNVFDLSQPDSEVYY